MFDVLVRQIPTKTVTHRVLLGCLAIFLACGIPSVALAGTRTIRVVAYNIDADQGQSGAQYTLPQPGLIVPSSGGSVTNGGVLEGIGEENVAGDPAQPIDILALEETTSNTTTVQPIVDGLNAFYSSRNIPAGYAMSPYQATEESGDPTTGNGPNAMVYNTNTLQLVASVGIGTPFGSSNGEYRQPVRYEFAPARVTPTTNNEFYVYVSHYKASSGSANAAARNGEAQIIRADSATLPSNARVLYMGDYNCTTSTEPMYQTLTAPGTNQAFDVLNPSDLYNITWNTSTLSALTESAPSLSTRDDYQMMTSNVLYGVAGGGLAYVPGSYHAFANNGTTRNVNSGSDTALNNDLTTNVTGITATQIYQYLTTATDHLPIVADYNIPAPTVFVIVLENENWASISGNVAAPYINNTLLPMASHAEQYFNPPGNHPSLPNYLWLEAGTNFGIAVDEDPSVGHQSTTNHLVTLLKNAGISWTSYQEDISGTVCPLTATNQYVPEHNPMVYFDDVTNTNSTGSTYCIANVRPFTELATDLQSNLVTRYNFITPNLCDDMQGNAGCPAGSLITQADTWLSNIIPMIVNSQAYSNNGIVFITWDQGQGGDGPIGMIVISPLAKGGGYANSNYYSHSSTLLTLQGIFNVGPLLGDAANAADLSDLFIYGPQLAVSPASGLSSSGGAGGSFSPSNQVYTLTNTGGVAMAWSATNTVNWLTLSATSGTLATNTSTNVTVSINVNANSLAVGSYSDTVVFATSNGSGTTTRPVNLLIGTAAAQLSVTPSSGFVLGGPPGGPFGPSNQVYTVINAGGVPMNWTANISAPWLTLSATNGTLASAASTNITVSINPTANTLAAGNYSDTIGFTNTTNGASNTTRAVTLTVANFGFYDDYSTFATGNLVGQSNWVQLGGSSTRPLQVTNGTLGIPGMAFSSGTNQAAYKSCNFETVEPSTGTNKFYYGISMAVTSVFSTPSPFMGTTNLLGGGSGLLNFQLIAKLNGGPYLIGCSVNGQSGYPYTYGTGSLTRNTNYIVIVEADLIAGNANDVMRIFVNPTNSNVSGLTPYAVSSYTSGTVTDPVSAGALAVVQFTSGALGQDGIKISRMAAANNFTTVYDDLLGIFPPAASFTASPTNGSPPLAVTFTDTSTGTITNRFWDFGDGGTTNITTNSVVYTYSTPGTYSVTQIVSGPGGMSTNTQSNAITVVAPPQAFFTGSPTSGMGPLMVVFTDTSTGIITNRYWDFGDTSTINVTTNGVTHVYAAGTYNVTLIVSGPNGSGTNTQFGYITALTAFQAWQNQYFGTNSATAAAGADPLGKGISNTNQFLMGLNPTNPASMFRIIHVATTGNDVVVTWQTSGGDASGLYGSGKTNVLEVAPGLSNGSYSNNFVSTGVTNVITTLGDVITNAVDAGGATNVPSRYYQIQFIAP